MYSIIDLSTFLSGSPKTVTWGTDMRYFVRLGSLGITRAQISMHTIIKFIMIIMLLSKEDYVFNIKY